MSRDDAILSLERHATSKIRTAQDLVGVRSFGFRGEALAAICSVSQLELETAPDDGEGTLVRAAGGAVLETSEIARRRGTTVRVSRLFYNAPARLKFLRGARSEWRAILDGDRIDVAHASRRAPHGDARRQADAHASGRRRASRSTRRGVRWRVRRAPARRRRRERHDARVRPRRTTGRRRHGDAPRLSLDQRARDSATWASCARRKRRIARRFPPVFARRSFSTSSLRRTWSTSTCIRPRPKCASAIDGRWNAPSRRRFAARSARSTPARCSVARRGRFRPRRRCTDARRRRRRRRSAVVDADRRRRRRPVRTAAGRAGDRRRRDRTTELPTQQAEVPPLVQLRRTFLMFEHDDGVVLIDQHSAHERVLYEQFMRTLERGRTAGAAPALSDDAAPRPGGERRIRGESRDL